MRNRLERERGRERKRERERMRDIPAKREREERKKVKTSVRERVFVCKFEGNFTFAEAKDTAEGIASVRCDLGN